MYRYLCIITPGYKDPNYIKTKQNYNDNLYEMHKRLIKIKTIVNKNKKFEIRLIGFDGKCKKIYKKLNIKQLFDDIKKMPMGYIRSNSIKPGLSLYSNYNPKTTIKGTGFKDIETAKHTLNIIKDKDISYQRRVIQTMYNRAKFHPHQTKKMRDAMKIYKDWLEKHKK